jgi:hypothetical protein
LLAPKSSVLPVVLSNFVSRGTFGVKMVRHEEKLRPKQAKSPQGRLCLSKIVSRGTISAQGADFIAFYRLGCLTRALITISS